MPISDMPDSAARPVTRRADGHAGAGATPPVWNLDDFYHAIDAPELARDLARGRRRATAFAADFRGRVAKLDGPALGRAIRRYEAIQEILARVMTYAELRHAADIDDMQVSRFHQDMQERTGDISRDLLFFEQELCRLDEAALNTRTASANAGLLRRYRPWLTAIRAFAPHRLRDDLERLLHEKQVAGRAAWTRLYDETLAALRFPFQGEKVGLTDILHRLGEPDEAGRKQAAKALGRVLGQRIQSFALITNTLAKDKQIEDDWRAFAHPVASRNLANRVEDDVVASLIRTVKAAFPAISHRYYRLKAARMGSGYPGARLDYWNRLAPPPEEDARTIPWPEARRIVLDAYRRFSPEMATIGARFFDRGWIDAATRPGKTGGAFAHPATPSVHPCILLNYQGRVRDVMTLAHELGHGIHQIMAAEQGYLMADTPLTLAETASVFGEMLTFRAMLADAPDAGTRRAMLTAKIEDMINTVIRQIAFHEFERRLHEERRAGELSPERLGEIWLQTSRESLGDALRFDAGYAHYWAYIPHFIHTPFYVYAYAFGDCLVNSLYALYQDGEADFVPRYHAMLRAGGALHHRDLLAPFGLDAAAPDFWQRGLDLLRRMIDELALELEDDRMMIGP